MQGEKHGQIRLFLCFSFVLCQKRWNTLEGSCKEACRSGLIVSVSRKLINHLLLVATLSMFPAGIRCPGCSESNTGACEQSELLPECGQGKRRVLRASGMVLPSRSQ